MHQPQNVYPVDGTAASQASAFTAKRYAHSDGLYWGSPETCDALTPGFYMPLMIPNIGAALKKLETKTDDLLRLPDPVCDMLLNEFVLFWTKSDEMRC